LEGLFQGVEMALKSILLAKPRGFCAGVVRAVDIVERVLELVPAPIYVYHEIVHNKFVVESLSKRQVVFVNSLEEVPEGQVCIYSAHGVSPQIRELAKRKHLRVVDATCPLVTKVHLEALRYVRDGYSIILIGHAGHEEVEGTMGEASMVLVSSVAEVEKLEVPNPEKVAYLTQTTLSLDDMAEILKALRKKFPKLVGPSKDDICYATQNRQNAIKQIANHVDLMLVVGSQNSSNSQRLREVALAAGKPAYLINNVEEINEAWLQGVESVGVTAGASAPEEFVSGVIEYLKKAGATCVDESSADDEDVHFSIPVQMFESA
jgi:4-hydroxy-3-methylbut-2-enyl diphosphate reductase